jgi:protein-S-isoprenylcysteine O-methyltransferase Ste14
MIGTFLRWFFAPFVLLGVLGLMFGNPWLLVKIVAGLVGFILVSGGLLALASHGRRG